MVLVMMLLILAEFFILNKIACKVHIVTLV